MKIEKRIIASIIYIFLGTVLLVLGFTEVIDEFWSGMGSPLIVIGVIRMIQFYRFQKDDTYREKVKIEMADERNRFIRNKAWAWAGYLFMLFMAVFTILLRVMGQDLLATAAGLAVCSMMLLYWICYLVLRKKY